jgi:hypothetical protein
MYSEHDSILRLLRTGEDTEHDVTQPQNVDVYHRLLQKEERVLDTIDRVINDSVMTEVDSMAFVNLPLHVIILRTVDRLTSVLQDLLRSRSVGDFKLAVSKEDRLMYIGIVIIVIAIVSAMLQSALL